MYKILFSLVLIFLSGCSRGKEERPEVLVSIPPYLYFVNALTEGQIKAVSLVPEGSNPHLFEPTPKQVRQAKAARVWVRLSESFETKIAKSLREQNKNLIVVNLAESSEISYLEDEAHVCPCSHHHHDHSHEGKDLHIWLSLRLAKIQAKLIAEGLIQAFPEHKTLIQNNLIALEKTFTKADELFTQKLLPFKGDAILVSHPAFGYFCRDYGLEQISIEVEGKDPLPKDLSAILSQAERSHIRTVFTQAQYNNKGAELIAQQLHLPVHEIDPYSADYLSNFGKIVHDIVEP